jgi:hypothetical protein
MGVGFFDGYIYLRDIPSPYCKVCVCEMPFSLEEHHVDTTGSPNVYFTTECTIGIEQSNAVKLSIYPNPTNNIFTIETEQPEQHTIDITSLNGQVLYSTRMKESPLQIDLSSLQKGIYFITVRSRDQVWTEKIIKL